MFDFNKISKEPLRMIIPMIVGGIAGGLGGQAAFIKVMPLFVGIQVYFDTKSITRASLALLAVMSLAIIVKWLVFAVS